jgi:SET domain-containing protein
MTENKGRSVVTCRPFYQGEFVCNYEGELIDEKEARKRNKEYGEQMGSFMLSFEHEGKKLW